MASLLAASAGVILAVGCGFSSDVTFGTGGQPFDPLDPLGTGGGSGKPGASSGTGPGGGGSSGTAPLPATCGDGIKNGGETDVDCGTSCARPCAVSNGCATGADCIEKVCANEICQPPTGTDGAQNGDESGVDCGGILTGAARCAVGAACLVNTDCESRGCSNGLCIEAPSCVAAHGGNTCGAGEVGSGGEQHESCCTSIEVPGYADPARPGKRVFLDKYEITAGRMRAFVEAMTAQFAGQPDIKSFIANDPPQVWQPAWNEIMPSGFDGGMFVTQHTGSGGSNCGASCSVGTNYIFGSVLYQYSHGHNCYHGGTQSYGFSTYWYSDQVMNDYHGGKPRAYSQEILDVKSLNCTPSVMFQAFCHWDGGQLATIDVMNTVAVNLAPDGNVSGDGSSNPPYNYPFSGTDTDDAERVAAPGRFVADATMLGAAGPWMDLRGNMNEVMLQGTGFVITMPFGGVMQGSAHAGNNDAEFISHFEHKSAGVGARCMRFKN